MQQIQYEDYQKLIADRAHHWTKFSRRIGKSIPFDELMAEGNMEFVKAIEKSKRTKCQFSTMLYHRLENRYYNIVLRSVKSVGGKNRPYDSNLEGDILLSQMPSRDVSPERAAAFKEMVSHLSHDARLMVECTLNTPKELIWMLGHHGHSAKVTHHSLERYFTNHKGWPASRVRRAIAKVQGALKQL